MLKKYYKYVREWEKIENCIKGNKSVIFYSPLFFNKKKIAEFIASEVEKSISYKPCVVNSKDFWDGQKIYYQTLWNHITKNISVKSKIKVRDRIHFQNRITDLIRRTNKSLFIIMDKAGKNYEESAYQIVADFDSIFKKLGNDYKENLIVLVLDDYSLFYHEKWRTEDISNWDNFERIHLQQISYHNLLNILNSILANTGKFKNIEDLTRLIIRESGGHVGIVFNVLEEFKSISNGLEKLEISDLEISDIVGKTFIIERIRHLLNEDPSTLTSVALKYKDGRHARDYNDPIIQKLRQVGILQISPQGKGILREGVITKLIVTINESFPMEEALGDVVTIRGIREYNDKIEQEIANDNDFIILHISDIHVGDKFEFRIPNLSKHKNRIKLEDLIYNDVNKLNLIGKIDSIIISGDIVEKGKSEEFLRAKELIEKFSETLEVSIDKIYFVPGNHDVDWEPSELSDAGSLGGGSIDNFLNIFSGWFDKNFEKGWEIKSIHTKDKKRVLNLILLDSNYLEGPNHPGIGFISREMLEDVDNAMRTFPEKLNSEKYEEIVNWIVLHHHVFPGTSLPIEKAINHKITLLGNAAELLSFAEKWKVEAVLHGHEHQPCITVANRWPSDFDPQLNSILSIGCGSFTIPIKPLDSSRLCLFHRSLQAQ